MGKSWLLLTNAMVLFPVKGLVTQVVKVRQNTHKITANFFVLSPNDHRSAPAAPAAVLDTGRG
jgi:hypothetical protein